MSAAVEKQIADFEKEVMAFLDQKLPIPVSRITAATKLAIKHAKHYKHLVHVVERYFAKCLPEYKLYGIYLIDSICRAVPKASGEKVASAVIARFESKLEGMLSSIPTSKISSKDLDRIKHITSLWIKNGVFDAKFMRQAVKKFPPLFASDALEPATAAPDTASLVETLSKINPTASKTNADPLSFDYGEDEDGELVLGGDGDKTAADSILDISKGLPANIATLFATAVVSSGSSQPSQPSTPSLQTSFTPHQQAQLASLLAAQDPSFITAMPASVTTSNGGGGGSQGSLGIGAVDKPVTGDALLPPEIRAIPAHPANVNRVRQFDPTIELDQVKVLTRTLYVGGIPGDFTREQMQTIFQNYNPEMIGMHNDKFHAFVRLESRQHAEAAKQELWNNKAMVNDEQLRVNWACGTGHRETFDRRLGWSILPIQIISEADKLRYMAELGLDFLKEHTGHLLSTGVNPMKIMQPFHLGSICMEEPDPAYSQPNPTVATKRYNNQEDDATNAWKRQRPSFSSLADPRKR